MVFSSVRASLDSPNWNQQQLLQLPATQAAGGDASHVLPGLAAAQSADAMMVAAAGSPARSISMPERARLAKIVPQPQLPLKCPRCESTNTKFCYFNNYSLSQPRHFCKSCRRYWTRGGALRSVPVGGGCRRNKRSKSSSYSKSSAAASAVDQRQAGRGSSSSCTVDAGGIMAQPRQFPFLATTATGDYGTLSRLDLDNIAGSALTLDVAEQYQVGGGSSSALWLEQWRMQQFPLLGGGLMEAAKQPDVQPLYHFNVDGGSEGGTATSQVLEQLAPVKMDDRNNSFHLPRQLYLGLQTGNERHRSSGGWESTELPRFNSS